MDDPFNVALREYRQRCRQYVDEHGLADYRGSANLYVFTAFLGPLSIEWCPKWVSLETAYDGRSAHQENNNCITQASEGLVWEGLRLLRQHYVLDELSTI